jgi:uncharacterized protein with FMN-binding domain
MKKVTSIVAVVLIAGSLTACGNRNTAYKTPGTNPNGTNLNMYQNNAISNDLRNNVGIHSTLYKDGVYLGQGNKTSSGNQSAVVTIRGGRITDVLLKTLDAKGKEVKTAGNTTGSNINTAPYGSTYGSNGGTTGGTTNGTSSGVVTGSNVMNTNPNLPGSPMTGPNFGTNLENNGVTINNNTSVGINNGTTLTTYDRVRRDLANAIVTNQTHNVTINNAGNQVNAVNNWKLAVSRALATARR